MFYILQVSIVDYTFVSSRLDTFHLFRYSLQALSSHPSIEIAVIERPTKILSSLVP